MCNLFVTQSTRVIHVFYRLTEQQFNSQRENVVNGVGGEALSRANVGAMKQGVVI